MLVSSGPLPVATTAPAASGSSAARAAPDSRTPPRIARKTRQLRGAGGDSVGRAGMAGTLREAVTAGKPATLGILALSEFDIRLPRRYCAMQQLLQCSSMDKPKIRSPK